MFRAIVGAILFVKVGIPLIMLFISWLLDNGTVGCIIFSALVLLCILLLS